MAELGELLRKAREEKGLSLAQVEEATKIRTAYLQALEDEAWDQLPGRIYAKGFLKNYAHYLGLDSQHILGLYPESAVAEPVSPTHAVLNEPLEPFSLRRLWPLWLALVVIVVIVGAWWGYTRSFGALPFLRPMATSTAMPTPTSMPSPTPPPTTAPSPMPTDTPTPTPTLSSGIQVSVEIVGQRSWIHVEVDGQEAFAGTLEPGATNTWQAVERITLRGGNAGAVRVTVNGKLWGMLGQIDQVVEKEWTATGVLTPTPQATVTATP